MKWNPIDTYPHNTPWVIAAKFDGDILAWCCKARYNWGGWETSAGEMIAKPSHWLRIVSPVDQS